MSFRRRTTERNATSNGFTLVELVVVLTIVAIMTVMSAPSYYRAVKQSRADIAAANLRTIWAAQRLYWLENHEYTGAISTLQSLGLVDKQLPTSADTLEENRSGGFFYQAATTSGSFTATATNTQDGVTITIDQNGQISPTGVTLGFQ
ncbi:MAG: prepilin-type N-terminal cleavage/methylation domain-containing protein [Thermoguttaceae bacterium]